MTWPRGEPRTGPRSPLACRAAASGSTSSPQGFLPARQPRRTLGAARRNPRRGNPPPRRARSAGPHAPPRSPGRRLQPAEPPHPHRVTPRGGKQHRIRDDPVVRSPDGSRQIPRAVSADHHPRARAPGRTVRPPRHVPDLPARELPLQFAPALTVPHAVSLHGEQDAHLRAVVYLPPARDVALPPPATAHAPPARWPRWVTALCAPPSARDRCRQHPGLPGARSRAGALARLPAARRPCPYGVTNTTRRYRSSRQGVADDVDQRSRGNVRAHRPDRGHRPDAHLRPAASADDPGPVCGPPQRTTPAPARPPCRRPLPGNGSNAGPSSAASSTNTRGPHKSQGQHQWPSSGTPQASRSPATASRPRIADRTSVTVSIVATASYSGVESSTRRRPTSPACLAASSVTSKIRPGLCEQRASRARMSTSTVCTNPDAGCPEPASRIHTPSSASPPATHGRSPVR